MREGDRALLDGKMWILVFAFIHMPNHIPPHDLTWTCGLGVGVMKIQDPLPRSSVFGTNSASVNGSRVNGSFWGKTVARGWALRRKRRR